MGHRRSIQLAQNEDTAISHLVGKAWECRYSYMRSAESRAADEPGQDYLALQEHESGLLFVVCDGVSMSYYGDFAAKFVGERLLDWLASAQCGVAGQNASLLQLELNRYLQDMTAEATGQLERHMVDARIQGLLREVLMDKKSQGSSAMFVGGRLDFPNGRNPDGGLLLVRQGDIRVRLWAGEQEQKPVFGSTSVVRHQWNSVMGPIGGMPHVYSGSLVHRGENEGTLLVYSDGLYELDSWERTPGVQLGQCVTDQSRSADSDDISAIQIDWNFGGNSSHQ